MSERVYCECPDADRGRHIAGCLFTNAATDPRLDGYHDFLVDAATYRMKRSDTPTDHRLTEDASE